MASVLKSQLAEDLKSYDYDVLPVRRRPEKDRIAHIYDGICIGRHSRRGAKTPLHKTCYRGKTRGSF